MLASALRWYMVDSIGSGSDFFHVSGIVYWLIAGTVIGIPLLVVAYKRIYAEYKI